MDAILLDESCVGSRRASSSAIDSQIVSILVGQVGNLSYEAPNYSTVNKRPFSQTRRRAVFVCDHTNGSSNLFKNKRKAWSRNEAMTEHRVTNASLSCRSRTKANAFTTGRLRENVSPMIYLEQKSAGREPPVKAPRKSQVSKGSRGK